jgi:hypothetical protein
MNMEYILMISFYTLMSIVALKSENSIKMALRRKIVRDVILLVWSPESSCTFPMLDGLSYHCLQLLGFVDWILEMF